MKITFSARALDDYQGLSGELQRKTDKQLNLLLHDLKHPSLRAKKYDEAKDIWQGRINKNYRFYFCILGDTCQVITIKKHPK